MKICGRDGRMLAARVEQKNEMTKDDKNGKWRDAPWTNKAPYKPYAGKLHVRICAGGHQQWRSLPQRARQSWRDPAGGRRAAGSRGARPYATAPVTVGASQRVEVRR